MDEELLAQAEMPYVAEAPVKQVRTYKDLAARTKAKLDAKKAAPTAATPQAMAGAPLATQEIAANEFGLGKAPANVQGMQGFGEIMNSPEAWLAGQELAKLHGDTASLAMMNSGKPQAVPYGGKKAWSEAAAEGLKTGIGMYNFLRRENAVSDALRNYKALFDKRGEEQKAADLDRRLLAGFAPGKGSGQHSLQGLKGDDAIEFDI